MNRKALKITKTQHDQGIFSNAVNLLFLNQSQTKSIFSVIAWINCNIKKNKMYEKCTQFLGFIKVNKN